MSFDEAIHEITNRCIRALQEKEIQLMNVAQLIREYQDAKTMLTNAQIRMIEIFNAVESGLEAFHTISEELEKIQFPLKITIGIHASLAISELSKSSISSADHFESLAAYFDDYLSATDEALERQKDFLLNDAECELRITLNPLFFFNQSIFFELFNIYTARASAYFQNNGFRWCDEAEKLWSEYGRLSLGVPAAQETLQELKDKLVSASQLKNLVDEYLALRESDPTNERILELEQAIAENPSASDINPADFTPEDLRAMAENIVTEAEEDVSDFECNTPEIFKFQGLEHSAINMHAKNRDEPFDYEKCIAEFAKNIEVFDDNSLLRELEEAIDSHRDIQQERLDELQRIHNKVRGEAIKSEGIRRQKELQLNKKLNAMSTAVEQFFATWEYLNDLLNLIEGMK